MAMVWLATIPSPDAALGDGQGRRATLATLVREFAFEYTP
jgi:hypothetical protein